MNVFDLFAGCGGLSSGLSKAGLKVKWANEFWKPAAETYRSAHPETQLFTEDASELLSRLISGCDSLPNSKEVDVIVGGPPCQGFSGFNRHRTPKDPRNSMLDVYLGFVYHLKPRLVMLENVPGILTLDEGRIANALLSSLENLGYSTKVGLLQAGYYGLPQNRWRTFIFAAEKGQKMPAFPVPTHDFDRIIIHGCSGFKIRPEIVIPESRGTLFCKLKPKTSVRDAIFDLPEISISRESNLCKYTSKAVSEYQKLLRTNNQELVSDHVCGKIEAITQKRIDALPDKSGAGWLDLPDDLKPKNLVRHGDQRYANRYGRLEWGGIFNTILTRPHPYWSRVIHPNQNRLISVRECARAQGFSDSTIFKGSISDRYKQIGNAVPPLLAACIGKGICDSFN